MKKMGLLIALATVLTVGGVYATWQYADADVTKVERDNISVLVEEKQTVTAGTLSVTGEMSFKIDQSDAAYHGKLVEATANQKLTFTFAPTAHAPAEFKDGVQFVATISISEAGEYDSEDILVVIDATKQTVTSVEHTLTTFEIDSTDIISAIGVNQTFTVPTSAAHDDFTTAVNDTKPTIKVTVDAVA